MSRNEWCVHYAGLHQKTHCRAEVAYLDVARPLNDADRAAYEERHAENQRKWGDVIKMPPLTEQYGIMERLPCFKENGLATCAQLRFRTPEEIEADEQRWHVALERMATARSAIVKAIKDAGKWKQSVRGVLACPVCGTGTLHYSYAGAYNGHIHGKCTTEDCVCWME